MKNRILITGSTGFVGRHLVPALLEGKYSIAELTRNLEKSEMLFGNDTLKIATTDPKLKEKIKVFKPNIVIHLASYLTSSDQWKDVESLIDTNLLFLSKILNATAESNIDMFVNTGTFAEYSKGDNTLIPAYFYAATKTASRSLVNYYANAYSFKQTTIVPYTIYGGKDSQKKIIDIIFDSIHNPNGGDLSPGEQVLDFIHIKDIVDFYMHVVKHNEKLPLVSNFKLGTGQGHTLRELASLIEELTLKKTNINWGARTYRNSDVMRAVADIQSIKEVFDWEPKISLREGLNYLGI